MKEVSINPYPPISQFEIRGHTTQYSSFQFEKHFHDHYTFILIRSGVNQGFTGNTHYKLGPGSMLIINPAELHAGHSYQQNLLCFDSIRIDSQAMNALLEKVYNNSESSISKTALKDIIFRINPINDVKLATQFNAIFQNLTGNSTSQLEENLFQFIDSCMSRYSNTTMTTSKASPGTQFSRLIQYLHEEYNNSISLDTMADVACLSPFHFIRSFKKEFGLTPFQYLRNIRIEKSKSQLGKNSITRTALSTGFFDQSHFVRHFKRVEGTTPKAMYPY